MQSYTVITDLEQIASNNTALGNSFKKVMKYSEEREITFPSGHFQNPVSFQKSSGQKVRAWSPQVINTHYNNFILIAEPNTSDWIEILVQLNFPAKKYTRTLAGAFVRDDEDNVWLAHRGKLTKGNGSLKMAKVLDEFENSKFAIVNAEDHTPKGKSVSCRLILIAKLQDAALLDKIFAFAEQARAVATRLSMKNAKTSNMAGAKHGTAAGIAQGTKSPSKAHDLLKEYFKEFSGKGTTRGRAPGNRIVLHGDIVDALEVTYRHGGESFKNRAIDLAIVSNGTATLYEVKTSENTTSVYTGVGQLLIHGEAIGDILKMPVTRILVLPNPPCDKHRPYIKGKCQTQIITYKKIKDGYSFEEHR